MKRTTYDIKTSDLSSAIKLAEWGTFGIDGKSPLKYVRLVDCSTEHLLLILTQVRTQGGYMSYETIIETILESRLP